MEDKKLDEVLKEATSNIEVENAPLNKQELSLIKNALVKKINIFEKNSEKTSEKDRRK